MSGFREAAMPEAIACREEVSRAYVPLRAEGYVRVGDEVVRLEFRGRQALIRILTEVGPHVTVEPPKRERGPVRFDPVSLQWRRW